MDNSLKRIFVGLIILGFFAFWFLFQNPGMVLAQQPTVALPTVTGTPKGPFVEVRPQEQEQINVRSGPGTIYPKVGVLLIGQQLPAKGRSAGGEWIMVEYPGIPGGLAWVYAPLVNLIGGEVPIIEPPPTPTPLYTPTIDPTLAARFVVTSIPTRLPTYTPPVPLVIPTFLDNADAQSVRGIPMGLVIIVMYASGLLIGLFTMAQGR